MCKKKCIIATLKKGNVLDAKGARRGNLGNFRKIVKKCGNRIDLRNILLGRAEKFCQDRATLSLPSCANDAMQPISIHRWKAWRNYDQDTKMKVVITYWNGANLEMCVCGGGVTPSPLFPGATSLVL
jgi:hypothetical protein